MRPGPQCLAEVRARASRWASHGAAEPVVGILGARASNNSVKFRSSMIAPLRSRFTRASCALTAP
eukprot:3460339-Pyramimonas_sp.AAC.1